MVHRKHDDCLGAGGEVYKRATASIWEAELTGLGDELAVDRDVCKWASNLNVKQNNQSQCLLSAG